MATRNKQCRTLQDLPKKIKLLNKELDALFLQRLQGHFIAGSLQIMR